MRLFFILMLLTVVVWQPVVAQDVNPSKVKVEELTDDQIFKLISEIEKRGMSESDAISFARARGMTQSQIDMLKKRIEENKKKSSLKGHTAVSGYGKSEPLNDQEDVYSRKVLPDTIEVNEKVFGFSLFNSDKLSFEPSVNIPVSQGYIIGAGDEIIIEVWGLSQQTYELTVEPSGVIQIPLAGPVKVGGITLGEATSLIKSKLTNIYGDLNSSSPRTFLAVRTGDLNPIRVNVIGESFAPGTYTLPGTATLFNVLYLCGGPSPEGSFRDIQLIRAGKVIARLDVYDFLINGNTAVNVPLADDDVIMIPTYINRVYIDGQFKRKGIFEGKEGETVGQLINYAGGFTEEANSRRVELYRKTGIDREFKDVTADNMGSITIANGDSIVAGKIIDRFRNMLTIKGAVFMPGNYEYMDGMSLKELIDKSGGILENAFQYRGFIQRLKSNYTYENLSFDVAKAASGSENVSLRAGDVVFINSIDGMREKELVSITGMVQEEGDYPYGENMRLGELILLAGGFTEAASGASIEIMRKLPYEEAEKSTNKTASIFSFSVSRNLELNDEGADFVLLPFDEVSIRKMPGYREAGSVNIHGQVFYAGSYGLSSYTERISDMVKRAGGVTPNAYVEGAKLVRKVVISKEEMERRKELQRKDTTLHLANLDFEIISINLSKILKKPRISEDIFLEAGDEIIIPGYDATVKMSGQVLNPSSTVYVDGISAKSYINMSGGFANDARRGRVYVIYPNGGAAATKGNFLVRRYPKVMPGSEIVVPRRPQRDGMTPQAWIGLGSALASIGLTIATIVSLNNK